MLHDIVDIAPTTTLREAIDGLRTHHVPSAPVRLRGRVVGVIGHDDLALLVHPAQTESSGCGGGAEPMPFNVNDGHDMALARGETQGGGRSERSRWASREEAEVPIPISELLERLPVAEVMCLRTLSLSPETDAATALKMMRRLGDHQVLVMDGDELLGVVYERDLADAVSEEKG